MHNHKILLSVAVIIFVILATSCGNSKKKAEPEKENFVVTIPAQNDTGRIRVYDHGELVFDYSGKINIINDGRNGNAIEIEARTKEKGYE